MSSRHLVVALALLPAIFGACKHAAGGDESAVKVTNGIATDAYAWVVELDNPSNGELCSGTFVSDTTLLTAAHCLDGTPTSGMRVANASPTKVFWTGPTGHDAALKNTDLAIMLFGPGAAPATTTLAPSAPKAGDAAILVGYGLNDVNASGSIGTKRQGSNVVAGLAPGFIHLKGVPAASAAVQPGAQVASAPGDSGGPLFVKEEGTGKLMLAGVDSGGGVHADGLKHSYYVDLSSPQSCAMLATAIAGGAVIDPLPKACPPAVAPTPTPPPDPTPDPTPDPSTTALDSTPPPPEQPKYPTVPVYPTKPSPPADTTTP